MAKSRRVNMYSIIYFSPTGNSKFLANKLATLLEIDQSKLYRLEKTDYTDIEPNDHLVFMYPIHGFNPPRTVKRFIKYFPRGKFKSVSLIAIGCNNLWLNDAVSLQLRKYFGNLACEIVVDEIIVMPLTLVMDFPKVTKEKVIKDAVIAIEEIANSIKSGVISNRKIKFKSKVITTVGKLENPAARLFGLELHANKTCTSCGICWNNCPEDNIKQNKKNKPKFGFSCSMCMRCIYQCPEKSISPYISKFLKIKNGYKLEE